MGILHLANEYIHNRHLSIFGQTTCPKIIRYVHSLHGCVLRLGFDMVINSSCCSVLRLGYDVVA